MKTDPIAVLTSGGLDSAILVAYLARTGRIVHPLYIRSDLHWENVELEYLRNYLMKLKDSLTSIQPLAVLYQPVTDLYQSHWSTTGTSVPDSKTPDEAVYLPGRNLLLCLKGLLWCHLHKISALALGVLGSNPFPDASDAFFDQFLKGIQLGVNDASLRIERPFGKLHKADVMKLGEGLPLEWSYSCIQPKQGLHCGTCNKCAERQQAFRDAKLHDLTRYYQ